LFIQRTSYDKIESKFLLQLQRVVGYLITLMEFLFLFVDADFNKLFHMKHERECHFSQAVET